MVGREACDAARVVLVLRRQRDILFIIHFLPAFSSLLTTLLRLRCRYEDRNVCRLRLPSGFSTI